jgi:hypothetical protein
MISCSIHLFFDKRATKALSCILGLRGIKYRIFLQILGRYQTGIYLNNRELTVLYLFSDSLYPSASLKPINKFPVKNIQIVVIVLL